MVKLLKQISFDAGGMDGWVGKNNLRQTVYLLFWWNSHSAYLFEFPHNSGTKTACDSVCPQWLCVTVYNASKIIGTVCRLWFTVEPFPPLSRCLPLPSFSVDSHSFLTEYCYQWVYFIGLCQSYFPQRSVSVHLSAIGIYCFLITNMIRCSYWEKSHISSVYCCIFMSAQCQWCAVTWVNYVD